MQGSWASHAQVWVPRQRPQLMRRHASAKRRNMTDRLVIALAQLNPTMGAIAANLALARKARASAAGADIILYSELFICGYPPEDLVLRPSLVKACREAVEELAKDTKDGPAVLIGTPWNDGGKLRNAVALLSHRRVEALRFQHDLPNYLVVDENREFDA